MIRLAIRSSGGAIVDPMDQQEQQRTTHCLSQSVFAFLAAIVWAKLTRPMCWLKAMRMTWAMSRRSERGLVRHIAYLIEAALLLRLVMREKVQHLHVHFGTNAAAVARLMRCLGGPPYSMTVHGPDEFDAPRGFALSEKIADAVFVVAISDYCRAQLCRWAAPEHWSKVHVVHCSVSDEFVDAAQSVQGLSRQFVSVGRLSAQKGQFLLIEAVRRLVDDGVDVSLVLAGDGEMRTEIEQQIACNNLQDHLSITGWIDEAAVRRNILESRALVQPSFAEGLPVVMMEALALGRPVIATSIAGVPELVQHGINGWLIPAGNVDELVNAMREALNTTSDRLNQMGAVGQARVSARHRIITETDKLESLFLQSAARGAHH